MQRREGILVPDSQSQRWCGWGGFGLSYRKAWTHLSISIKS